MIPLKRLNDYLEKLLVFDPGLDIGKIDPFMANGLTVKGNGEIGKIGFAVSASVEIFKLAQKNNCRALIVHHVFNLPKINSYDFIFQNRIGFLVKNNISLFGYHFLLDAHPEIGNNASILKTVGFTPEKPYLHLQQPWGYMGKANNVSLTTVKNTLKPYLSPRSVFYDFGPKNLKKIVAVSGKGAPHPSDMTYLINENIDLFITGEVHEWTRELFRETGINFIAGGHYHTEMFGIKALMAKVKKDLPQITSVWLELDNEI